MLPLQEADAVRDLFEAKGQKVAAVVVEPTAANTGAVPRQPGFTKGVCEITRTVDALPVFDEVMTGFRVALGSAHAHHGGIDMAPFEFEAGITTRAQSDYVVDAPVAAAKRVVNGIKK